MNISARSFITYLIFLILPVTILAQGPSFSCKYAKSITAVAICGSPQLSAKDLTMANLYQAVVRENPGQAGEISRAHSQFIKSYKAKCGPLDDAARATCIASMFDNETHSLEQFLPKPKVTDKVIDMVRVCFNAAAGKAAATLIIDLGIAIISGDAVNLFVIFGDAAGSGIQPCIQEVIKELW
jgi:uncharacterized protein